MTDLATGSVMVYDSTGAGAIFDTGLTSPQGIAFDNSQNLYVVDAGDGTSGAGTIFKYDLSVGGSRVPFRTGLNNPQGLAFDGSAFSFRKRVRVASSACPLMRQAHRIFSNSFPLLWGLAVRGKNDQMGHVPSIICNGPLVRQ